MCGKRDCKNEGDRQRRLDHVSGIAYGFSFACVIIALIEHLL
jgi:hypothetical protein